MSMMIALPPTEGRSVGRSVCATPARQKPHGPLNASRLRHERVGAAELPWQIAPCSHRNRLSRCWKTRGKSITTIAAVGEGCGLGLCVRPWCPRRCMCGTVSFATVRSCARLLTRNVYCQGGGDSLFLWPRWSPKGPGLFRHVCFQS